MKKLQHILTASATFILIGCGGSSSWESENVQELQSASSEQTEQNLEEDGYPTKNYQIHGYKSYKISYTTSDQNGKELKASGLFVVPKDIDPNRGVALVSYSHGTIILNANAPSIFSANHKLPHYSAIFFTIYGGMATASADYIGYGDSVEHYHPYLLKKSSANASVDFIKAVREFAKKKGIKLNGNLFVAGYSEGGYVSMATLQKLQEQNIKVKAAAPMAGPYDLKYAADSALGLNGEDISGFEPSYNILTFNAYTKAYDKNISTVIKPPYDKKIDTLLDKKHTFKQITEALPDTLDELLQDDFKNSYVNDSNNWFVTALKENSVNSWLPKSKIRLVHCKGDDQVPYTIAKNTYNTMKEKGADIELVTPDKDSNGYGHTECAFPALSNIAYWFYKLDSRN